MKRRITSVGPLKIGITFAIIQGGFSLLMILPMYFMVSLMPLPPGQQPFPMFLMLFIPVGMTFMSFVMGIIISGIYNLISKFTGGVEISVEEVN